MSKITNPAKGIIGHRDGGEKSRRREQISLVLFGRLPKKPEARWQIGMLMPKYAETEDHPYAGKQEEEGEKPIKGIGQIVQVLDSQSTHQVERTKCQPYLFVLDNFTGCLRSLRRHMFRLH